MSIRRVVPSIESDLAEQSRAFYVGFLGFEVAMDMGFIVTFASPSNPTAQISIVRPERPSHPHPNLTVKSPISSPPMLVPSNSESASSIP